MRGDDIPQRRLVLIAAAALACGTPEGPGFIIEPEEASDRAEGTAIPDVNGDGLDDIAVETESGRGYVVFGKKSATRVDLAKLSARKGVTFDAEPGVRDVVAAGDVNGDGFADLIVLAGPPDRGYSDPRPRVYVVFGGPGLASQDLDALDPADGRLVYTIEHPDIYWSEAAGDINGDGFADLVVVEGTCCWLHLRVIYGGDDIHEVTGEELDVGVGGVALGGSYLVEVHGVGDVNGDGFDDLAVSPVDQFNSGEPIVHVLFGGEALVPQLNLTEPLTVDGFTITGSKGPNLTGGADLDGDGLADLVLASYGDAYVIFGKADRMPVVLPEALAEGAGVHLEPPADVSGDKVVPMLVPDRDGDGLPEVTLARRASRTDEPPVDHAELIYGLDKGTPVTVDDPRREGINDWPAGERLGLFGGWGMIDGRGGPDFVVSQHSTPDEPARIYVYFDPGSE